jgi:2-phospho-L-lactate guanylyltransferase (CobY/MobA/RfbA family)
MNHHTVILFFGLFSTLASVLLLGRIDVSNATSSEVNAMSSMALVVDPDNLVYEVNLERQLALAEAVRAAEEKSRLAEIVAALVAELQTVAQNATQEAYKAKQQARSVRGGISGGRGGDGNAQSELYNSESVSGVC